MMKISNRFFQNIFNEKKERLHLLSLVPKNGVCAEIGVWKGGFSRSIQKTIKPKKFYLIDPWKYLPEYSDRWYGGAVARNQKDMDKIFYDVRKVFKDKKSVIILRMNSSKASKLIKNNSLDFVYIDGNHTTEFVFEDLTSYFKKLRTGGVMAGDDFFWRPMQGFPVARGLIKFIKSQNINATVCGKGFYIRK